VSVNRVASAYAKSILDLAIEQNLLGSIYQDMLFAKKVCDASRELRQLLVSPIIPTFKKVSIVNEIFVNKVSDATLKLFHLIIKKRREDLMYFIVLSYIEQYKESQGIKTATLVTTIPATNAVLWQTNAILSNFSNKIYELNNVVDPSILGGFILTSGDRQLDTSVRSQLSKIKNQFSK
jgi:F-type H+-transporting ATPase subunit delta